MTTFSFRLIALAAVCLPFLAVADSAPTKNPQQQPAAPAAKTETQAATPQPPGPQAAPAQAEVDTQDAGTEAINFKLIELFNVEQLPGSGALTLQFGDKSEKIAMGKEGGFYALGMVFDGKGLPDQYGKDFKKNQIVQLAMGSVPSRVQGQIPQFGALTLITNKIPTDKKKYPLIVPQGSEKPAEEMAFLLMTSPTTPNDRSDEEKLKNTYFAQKGTLTFSPKGQSKLLELKSQGKRLQFKLQMMQCEFDATLVTPFNAAPGTLKGKIEFPLYTPHGTEAVALTRRIATESLETATSMALQEAMDGDEDGPRQPASKPAKSSKSKKQ